MQLKRIIPYQLGVVSVTMFLLIRLLRFRTPANLLHPFRFPSSMRPKAGNVSVLGS